MSKLKLKLFEFRKTLDMNQSEVAYVIDAHISAIGEITEGGVIGTLSDVETVRSLKEKLAPSMYYDNVKALVESLDDTLEKDQTLSELKEMYYAMERADSMLYRQPLNVLFEIINTQDEHARTTRIVNELSIYDWVPQIKSFMWRFSVSPQDRANMSANGGAAEDVYSVYIKTNEGGITFIRDGWFLVSEAGIKGVLLEDYIKDDAELRSYRLLEEAVRIANFTDDMVSFQLDEGLAFGINTSTSKIFLNESEVEAETTLETLFASNVVPFMHRGHYAVIGEAVKHIKKFAVLDVVKKVSNVLNPFIECYAFNFKDSIALYRADKRFGNSFYTYENASKLISDVKKDLDYDLTFFFEDKVSKDIVDAKKNVEREFKIKEQLQQVDDALFNISLEADVLKESEELRALQVKLLAKRHVLLEALSENANTDLELKSVAKQIFSVLKKYKLSPNYISGDIKLDKANDSSIIIGADKENNLGLITIYIFAWAVKTNNIDINKLSSNITQILGNKFENQSSKTSIGNDIVYKMLVRKKI